LNRLAWILGKSKEDVPASGADRKTDVLKRNACLLNALTIDVEDYFQVHAFSRIVSLTDWDRLECRIERNTERLLDLLDSADAGRSAACCRATFFVLGWIAERYPCLIRRIRGRGHEVACHGYAHQIIYTQTHEEFRADVRKAKSVLEDVIGEPVIGYRAPSYSITDRTLWAIDILIEEGFKYDSSIFPIRHDFYGFPDAPRFPFRISRNGTGKVEFSELDGKASPEQGRIASVRSPSLLHPSPPPEHSGSLVEFPISTVRVFGQNFPVSGGGYFRLFPYPLIESALKRINQKEKMPFIFYIHPWELDGEQPRLPNASLRSRFRHYVNLSKTEARLRSLLEQFAFAPVRDILRKMAFFNEVDHPSFHQEA
jgi:polysaccharide deacetylase family protein (PEP-CTERM system associated)